MLKCRHVLTTMHKGTRPSPDAQKSDSTIMPEGTIRPIEDNAEETDTVDHRLTRRNVTQMSAKEASDSESSRSGSYAAAGYVHLAPLSHKGGNNNQDGGMTRSNGRMSPPWSHSYGSVASTSGSALQYPKTTRFKYLETEQGKNSHYSPYHILKTVMFMISGNFLSLGRVGPLERCEDEVRNYAGTLTHLSPTQTSRTSQYTPLGPFKGTEYLLRFRRMNSLATLSSVRSQRCV